MKVKAKRRIVANKIFGTILLFLPASLITGPFLSDLIVSASAIYFVYVFLADKKYHLLSNKFVYLFLIYYLYLLLSSFTSNNILLSLESSLFFIRFLFFSLCVAYVVQSLDSFKEKLKYSFLLTITILVIDAYIQFFSGTNILGFEYSYSRVSGFFDEELVLGSFLARMMPIVLGLVTLQSKMKKIEIYYAILLLVSIDILTYLSGERTAFFLITLATITLILLVRNFRGIRLFSFLVSSLIIIILTFSVENVKERMIDQTINQTNILKQEKSFGFSDLHNRYYTTAIQMFFDKPVFGYGPKMYREACSYDRYVNLNGCSTHPHNNYLQSLAELGFIGTIPLFFLFFFVSFKLIKHLYYKVVHKSYDLVDYEICLLVAILLTLWPFAPTGNLFNNWLNIIYFMPVGLLLAEYININK